jgi:hypothetical protein
VPDLKVKISVKYSFEWKEKGRNLSSLPFHK